MVKIGLIGAGFMGSTHAACYEELLSNLNFKITAVADIDTKKAGVIAEKFGAEVFSSGKELIENADVNTVDICLPTFLHTSHAIEAMEMGYNVLIEKPVCLHESEAIQLMETKEKTGAKVMVGHCIRFWDEYVYLKKLIDENIYGSVKSAIFKRVSPKPGWAWDGWILDNNRSGSAALDLHIHDVDFVRYLFGMPENIKSEIVCNNGNDEHIFSLYRYNDKAVSIEGSWDYPSSFPFVMEYRVNFEDAAVVFNSSSSPALNVYEVSGNKFVPDIKKAYSAEGENLGGNVSSLGGYYSEIKYFLECLINNKEIENASLIEGVESFRLIKKEIAEARGKK